MLARKFSSLGRMRCPRAWRARKATLRPSSTPQTYASEGAPNGVFTRTSFTLVSPGIEYRPLPPIIPISAWATHPPKRAHCQKSSARVVQTRDYIKLIVRDLLAASGGTLQSPYATRDRTCGAHSIGSLGSRSKWLLGRSRTQLRYRASNARSQPRCHRRVLAAARRLN